jgi:hypothetical protein
MHFIDFLEITMIVRTFNFDRRDRTSEMKILFTFHNSNRTSHMKILFDL